MEGHKRKGIEGKTAGCERFKPKKQKSNLPDNRATAENIQERLYTYAAASYYRTGDDKNVLDELFDLAGGATWKTSRNWKTAFSLGVWHGITETARRSGFVSKIELLSNNLSGPIPASLGTLQSLEKLFLQDNALTGVIPVELGSLHQLQWLRVYRNKLSGSIPRELGNLTGLIHLYLSNNELSGSIPRELGSLASLIHLYLSNNELSGPIPDEIGRLENLLELDFSDNRLTGDIPASLDRLTKLRVLNLSLNQLTGSIPASLGDFESLRVINLDGNQLTGSIPASFGNLRQLRWISLASNQLSGAIPVGVLALSQRLNGSDFFSLKGNAGLILPENVGDLEPTIYVLDLRNLFLSGSIPESIRLLVNLQAIYFRSCEFEGGYEHLRHLENLTRIDSDADEYYDLWRGYRPSLAAWWQLFDIPADVMNSRLQVRLRYLRELFETAAEPLM